MIKIFTDSASYIQSDIALEYDITVLPLSLIIDGKEVLETEISNESFYKYIRNSKDIPESKALTTNEIVIAFEKEIALGNTIIGIFLSSQMSGTYENACRAKKKLLEKYSKANITIIDSKSVAMEQGLAVLSAAETVKSGAWLEDIIKATNDSISHTRALFIPHTLKYLEIGGRIGKSKALLGSALKMIPILSNMDGEVGLFEMSRVKSKAVDRVLEILKDDTDKYGVKNVVIQHIDTIEEAEALAKKAKEIAGIEVSICDIGPVLGAHVGPGALGLTYKTIKEMPKVKVEQ